MDIQQLLTGILEKHDNDDSFKDGMKSDGQNTLIAHFGEQAVTLIKEHMDDDAVKELLSGKGDIAGVIGSFLGGKK